MKRKAAALLCAVLLALLLPPMAASAAEGEKLTYVSINDTLPPELVNCVAVSGGVFYVPYYTFTNYGLGISYSYFTGAATAYLSTPEKQLFFELNSGDTYDGDDNHYSVSAIMRSGTVYVPVGLVCRFFGGMQYSSIAGNEYGSILRITTDGVVLTDAEFLRAARTLMRTYYQNYQGTSSGNGSGTPEETPRPATHEGDRVLLAFEGAPDAETLDALSRYGCGACFFLTAEETRADPDMARRLSGEGYGLGVWCDGDPAADWAETGALLFEAARARTILIAAPPERAEACRALADRAGLAWYGADFRTATEAAEAPGAVDDVIAALEPAEGDVSLLLGRGSGAGELEELLDYLLERRYEIACPRETDLIRRPTE